MSTFFSSSTNNNNKTNNTTAPELPQKRIELERFTRFSKSILWKLNRNFYHEKGIAAWTQGYVPHFITNNAYHAKNFTRLFHSFLTDYYNSTNNDNNNNNNNNNEEPFYIIELGGGCGKFAFLFLKALQERKQHHLRNIVYVLTDCTATNVQYYQSHPSLRPFFENGQLDVAILDDKNSNSSTSSASDSCFSIRLCQSGVVLNSKNPSKNPIVVIANYVFDTLCQDCFQVCNGQLREGLVSVGTTEGTLSKDDPNIIQHLTNEFTYRPVTTSTNKPYYSDSFHASSILNWYMDKFSLDDPAHFGASFLIPIGSIRLFEQIATLTTDKLFVMTGDKGITDPETMRGLTDPHLAIHGSFSVMVNFHAIGTYAISKGGFALYNQANESSLKICCFLIPAADDGPYNRNNNNGIVTHSNKSCTFNFGDERNSDFLAVSDTAHRLQIEQYFPNLLQSFQDNVESFGSNDFFVLQKCLQEETNSISLASVISLLKLSSWDTGIFDKFREIILRETPNAGIKLRMDFVRCIPMLWRNHFALDPKGKDLAFDIGRILYSLCNYREALVYYQISEAQAGPHHVTYYNMGLCYYALKDFTQAMKYFSDSHSLDKTYQKAFDWIQKIREEGSCD